MKKLFLLVIASLSCLLSQAQVNIPGQEIKYDVRYRWGIIDVMIAKGTVKIESDGNNFYGTLDGTSIPWEGKIICVSDTLNAVMHSDGNRFSETVRYQNGWYRHPSVDNFRSSDYNPANPLIYKNIAGQGEYNASGDSMEAITVTSDLIGMYYFAHAIDFSSLKPGTQLYIPIEGPYSRMLLVTYNGTGTYSSDYGDFPIYDCTLQYDYGGRMSGYNIDCKIGIQDRTPLYIAASLPLGHVEMLVSI